MSITAKDKGIKRELIPAGNYIARCYKMIEIGTIEDTYKGNPILSTKIRIGWELPSEMKVFDPAKGEQPLVIDKEYTLAMSEKANLRKMLASWRGKDFTLMEARTFDISSVVGAPCQLNIIHKHGIKDPTIVYQDIASVTPIAKGMKVPAQINPSFILSYDKWDEAKFQSLPDFIKDQMEGSDEYQSMRNPVKIKPEEAEINLNDIPPTEDDLPF